jgi:hypothetical protein
MKTPLRLPRFLLLAAILLAFPPAAAQYDDDGDDDGTRQAVARISWFEGEVSFNRGDDPDDWQLASINYPVTLGDRLWTGSDARAELQLRGGTVYLAPGSELSALDLTRDVRQLSLSLGTASFRIRRLERDEVFEVATPNVSVTFETPGVYRVDVDEEGNSRVSVQQGRAWAAAAGGQVALDRGDQVRVWGIDRPDYDVVGLARADAWDRWVESRARRFRSVRSASYVHPDIYGADDLDTYGSWEENAEYGAVWYPRGIAADWEPYRFGRWIWRDPWGWTWLSSEPWGWAPYHYGRWAVVRGRWCWVPDGPQSRDPGYSPAVVGFVGGGSGWSVSVSAGGFVGWFPLGPREPFHPWWYHARSTENEPRFNYAYRNRVTVVSRDAFVRGGRVDRDVVRDNRIMRDVSRAPVLRGPIPVLPTRDSIRVTAARVDGRGAIRPPEGIGRREVVTRTAPPPAPPSFDRKLEVIRERGGEPVPSDVARRLSTDEHRGARDVQPVRPAGRDEVLLSPRGKVETSRRPEPLPRSAGRPIEAGNRPTSGRDYVSPTRAPELRRDDQPERPTPAPRRVDVPDSPPARELGPAPQTDWQRAPTPTRPVRDAWPGRRETPRPERTYERPEPAPTPRVERVPVSEPRIERIETRPVPAEPERVAPRRGEPAKVEPAKVEPDKVEKKPTPTKPAARRRIDTEPGKKID